MHEIEPYHNWRLLYAAEQDERSPLFGQEHSEFEYSNTVYNYYIHPQWDEMGSRTLYLKILFTEYEQHFAIIEFIGEWNDALENDIMQLKRTIIDPMMEKGIFKFILIGENIMNFHGSDDSYYEEWQEEIADQGGWITFLNLPEQSLQEFKSEHLDRYCYFLDYPKWRTHQPEDLFQMIDNNLLRLTSRDD